MNNFKKRLRGIEEKFGVTEKRYTFIHIMIKNSEGLFSASEKKKMACFQKDDFVGPVSIIEERGEKNRCILSSEEEGKKILEEHGYRAIA
jgi:hypothetical protein